MMMKVTYKSFSAHDGNKLAANLQFAAEDGTTVHITCGMTALSMLELGETYVVSVDKFVEHPEAAQDAASAKAPGGRIDVTPEQEPAQEEAKHA